ncbi:MAG: hypothetical protein FWH12_07350 [Treponema sp.]|nr:hypothetical protein [Treponema sp.]
MITLERVRLVNWHNFLDQVIEIGNRCLLAGDNGSGKSTIIDAIQYAMAANLRMARFNSAAEERRSGGRDLMGYVRAKVGSESTEYRRGDTIAHVMMEWSGPEANTGFSSGVCIEAHRDNHYTEHFWISSGISPVNPHNAPAFPIKDIPVQDEKNEPIPFRRWRTLLAERKASECPTKQQYIRELTNRLGVWKRQNEINPYLDSLTRSIGFRPLDSIDQFVCNYILEENPVSIQDMKQNLENYKEAERQAKWAIAKINLLKKLSNKAAEWRNYDGYILKQEFLKLIIELENEKLKKAEVSKVLTETKNNLDETIQRISFLGQKRLDTEQALRAVEKSIASNDAHRLYEEIRQRIERLEHDHEAEESKAARYADLKGQCEALLNRSLDTNNADAFDRETFLLEEEASTFRDVKYQAQQIKKATEEQIRDLRIELSDLERGIRRYPEGPRALKNALDKAGIQSFFLSELAEVTDPTWADAAEGILNTRRFALLVDPEEFQRALEVYDGLPRSVSGAFLPNIEKMRGANPRPGSLAELIKADGYGRIYIDFILGKTMCADISSLKTYDSAVTKECMTYINHTASRIREDIYRHHYLGKAAIEKRRGFLRTELSRLEGDFSLAEKNEREAGSEEDRRTRVLRWLPEIKILFPSLTRTQTLTLSLTEAKDELSKIDITSIRELDSKQKELNEQLFLLYQDNDRLQKQSGSLEKELSNCQLTLDNLAFSQEAKEGAISAFAGEHPLMITACEEYAQNKLSETSIADLSNTYESTLQGFKTRTNTLKREYQTLVAAYNQEFSHLLGLEPGENEEAESLLKRLETSELPEYKEKITRAYHDAEKEFKDHFISRLNERIEEARESFKEINDVLRTLLFGRDQYWFHLEEQGERKGHIEVIRQAARIPPAEEGLFSQFTDPAEQKAAEDLFNRILNSPLDSKELRDICDYRSYFRYDIRIRETDNTDESGNPVILSLSRVLKEKSGGETQTPYYVAIAASFYKHFNKNPDNTVRLVIFDEAFNRMDDERIGKILEFYKSLNLQIITSVPPEKIEAIAPYMDRINVISRFGNAVKVRDCHIDSYDMSDIEIGTQDAS